MIKTEGLTLDKNQGTIVMNEIKASTIIIRKGTNLLCRGDISCSGNIHCEGDLHCGGIFPAGDILPVGVIFFVRVISPVELGG